MLILFPIIGLIVQCAAFEIEFTVDVAAAKMECFFQPLKKPVGIEVEYQVIDGGDLDINFFIQAPDNSVLVSEHRKTDNRHKFKIQTAGDIRVCFDNTFSHFANKLVFFEIMSDGEDDDEDDTKSKWNFNKEELEGYVDMTLDDFTNMMERLGQNLDKSRNLQTVLKMYEARDRNVVEMNFDRVNFLSLTQLIVMLVVGVVQVVMIRHLFDDRRKASGSTGTMKAKT